MFVNWNAAEIINNQWKQTLKNWDCTLYMYMLCVFLISACVSIYFIYMYICLDWKPQPNFVEWLKNNRITVFVWLIITKQKIKSLQMWLDCRFNIWMEKIYTHTHACAHIFFWLYGMASLSFYFLFVSFFILLKLICIRAIGCWLKWCA